MYIANWPTDQRKFLKKPLCGEIKDKMIIFKRFKTSFFWRINMTLI